MQTSDFDYDLPEALIAQRPLRERTSSRLLYMPKPPSDFSDKQFVDLSQLLQPGDLLVFNNTRVFPARLFGQKPTGGQIEILIERLLTESRVLAHVRASKSPKVGGILELPDNGQAQVLARHDDLFELSIGCDSDLLSYLQRVGHMPLPPYIQRQDDVEDSERYQTVFAEELGAVAAPTAGLHFDKALLATLSAAGIQQASVTLHVGAGTFQPVRVDNIDEHIIHAEQVQVSAETCEAIAATQQRGGRVVAVGTTVMRSLEAAASQGQLQAFAGETRLFIKPGFTFRVIDALITNFHLPRSSLLMLVSAFAGYEPIMRAYQHAIAQRYRFFSYGDAMFIEKFIEQSDLPK